MTQSQVFISLIGGIGDIIHEDFGSPICVCSMETRKQIDAVISKAQKMVREWVSTGNARFGRVGVRNVNDPLPPSGHLCWHTRDKQTGKPRLF